MESKYLTLSDVLGQSDLAPIWARNNVHRAPDIGREGALIINIPKPNGTGSTVLRIERTWLPRDLTTQMSRRQLLESSEFRAAVANKYIVLITEEYARSLLRSADAEDEQRRLDALSEYMRTATGVAGVTTDGDPAYAAADQDLQQHQQRPKAVDPATDMFMVWVASLEHKSDIQVLSELRTRRLNRKQARQINAKLNPETHKRSIAVLERSLRK